MFHARETPNLERTLAGLAQAEYLLRTAFPGHPWAADACRDAAHLIRTSSRRD